MMRSIRIAAVGAFAALVVAACSSNDSGSSSNDTTAPAPPVATTTADTGGGAATSGGGSSSSGGGDSSAASGTITIQNFQFGQPLQVKPGATITVTNKDTAAHNVVADDGTSFKTDLLDQNQSATFTAPTKPGTYTFSCTVHPNMKGIGTLVVAP
jgi:plastocyanin